MEEKIKFPAISILITGIVSIFLGVLIIVYGWNFSKDLKQSYNCIPCSIFDKECAPGYDTEKNHQCWDRLEWPYKFSIGLIMFGFIFIIAPFAGLLSQIYYHFKDRTKIHENRRHRT